MNEPNIWSRLYPDPVDGREIAAVFLEAARVDCAELRLARQAPEHERVWQLAHRIKGAAAMVGLMTLSAEAALLQQRAQQGEAMAEPLILLEQSLERLIDETAQWLATSASLL